MRIIHLERHPAPPSVESTSSRRADQWWHQRGNFFTVDNATDEVVGGEDIDAYFTDNDGVDQLLFKLRVDVTPECELKQAFDALQEMASKSANNNRGVAAGRVDVEAIQRRLPKFRPSKVTKFRAYGYKRDGTPSSTHIGNFAKSSVIGWTDSRLRNSRAAHACRLTFFSRKKMENYRQTFPLIQTLDRAFAAAVPDRHAVQVARARRTVARIADTAFSTVTVNYDFRTALHQDAGDYREGFGCIAAVHFPREPRGSGGELIFPEFRIGVRLRSRDALLFDTHQWHCNAPLPAESDVHRMSLVCYLRERLLDSCEHTNETDHHELSEAQAGKTSVRHNRDDDPVLLRRSVRIQRKRTRQDENIWSESRKRARK